MAMRAWRRTPAGRAALRHHQAPLRHHHIGRCDPGPLAEAIGALGEDNVMFSVDYPYEDSQIAADFIEAAPISEAVRAKVCHGNAQRVLRL
jgi:predicted TIM-barrel fold metal-dependent hydrolase